MNQFSFRERLLWSQGVQGFSQAGLLTILRCRIPGTTRVEKAEQQDDRNGTDFWAWRSALLPPLSIDAKVRSVDFAPRGQDDLALETWSVCDTRIGWTRDATKHTDFVIWYWTDTGRFFLAPFPALCAVFQRHWQEWSRVYRVCRQDSGAWQSECVYVPRLLVMQRMAAWANGVLTPRRTEQQAELWR